MAADIDMKKGYSPSIFTLARCYKLGIGTEKSLESAIYYYKFASENGFTAAYSEVAQCYRELGGEKNEKRADAYLKMAEAGIKSEVEEKIVGMKEKHVFLPAKKESAEKN